MSLSKPLPPRDADTILWSLEYNRAYGRKPRVDELPVKMREIVGAYVFALLDWHDEEGKDWSDGLCYAAALQDYALDKPEGYSKYRWCGACGYQHHPGEESPNIKNRYDLCPDCRVRATKEVG